ncbi:hypothetical protein AAZX31_06G216900 [Glycine max]|uniref:Protein IQ-DOMAIN 1 n=1 Tax=Glycine max TaxID=3847 RepID=A0A0R0JKS6_SOYBN
MSPKKWFKAIIRLRKPKEDKSKLAKVQSTPEKSNESSEEKQEDTLEEALSIPSEGLAVERTVPTRLIEDIAATRIQNAFRAFLARRTLHHLRGAVKFEALIQDHMAREQTVTALNYIHTWSRMQDQIKARRLYMITEARIKQKRLENQLKLEAKIHELQWRPNCSQYLGHATYSLGKESWGWSWKERWVAARPWEIRVRFQGPMTKKTNGQPQRSKVDKKDHNYNNNNNNNNNNRKVPLSKPELSNGKENNNIPELS